MKYLLIIHFFLLVSCEETPLGTGSRDLSRFEGPNAPSNLSFSDVPTLTASPTLSWETPIVKTGVTGPYTYKIGIGTSSSAPNYIDFIDVGDTLTYQFTNMPLMNKNTSYYFIVKAVDASGIEGVTAVSLSFVPTVELFNGGFRLPEDPSYLPNCSSYLNSTYNHVGSDRYWIDPDGAGGNNEFLAECDMTTLSGGWTLILNYVHENGDNTALDARTSSLPLIASSTLGDGEQGSIISWGHSAPSLLTSIGGTEARVYCITSTHARIIDFRTSHSGTINYFKTGAGSMNGIASNFVAMPTHTGNIPGTANSYFNSQGDEAMTKFSFYESGVSHWGVRGNGNRWECDDNTGGGAQDTIHRVWIR